MNCIKSVIKNEMNFIYILKYYLEKFNDGRLDS